MLLRAFLVDRLNYSIILTIKMKKALSPLIAICSLLFLENVRSDTFGTGANQFSIDFTTIGNPGNAADTVIQSDGTLGYGSVSYTFRMGTYNISQNQIDAAIASGLANVAAGAWIGNQPAANISWHEAAALVNWLNTSSGHQAAYNLSFDGFAWNMNLWDASQAWQVGGENLYRNANAFYFLPSENEWYKAAYGKSDGSGYYFFPTGSDNWPTAVSSGTNQNSAIYNQPWSQGPADINLSGGLSSYGTMGQGGNVWQWTESPWSGNTSDANAPRAIRGAVYGDNGYFMESYARFSFTGSPDFENSIIGFRVASVPEPSTLAFSGIGFIGLLMLLRRRKTV